MFLKCIDLYYLLINQAAPAFQQDVAMVSRPKQARAFPHNIKRLLPPPLVCFLLSTVAYVHWIFVWALAHLPHSASDIQAMSPIVADNNQLINITSSSLHSSWGAVRWFTGRLAILDPFPPLTTQDHDTTFVHSDHTSSISASTKQQYHAYRIL